MKYLFLKSDYGNLHLIKDKNLLLILEDSTIFCFTLDGLFFESSLNAILSCRLCLIHEAEVRWVKRQMVVYMRFFNRTMGLLALKVSKLHVRILSLAVLVMQLPAFYFNQRIGTTGIFFLTSMIYLFHDFMSATCYLW